MGGSGYVIVWIVLLLFPAAAAIRRYWAVCAVFVIGCVIYLLSILKDNSGWDDLADIATLLVVVLPIYVLALIVWGISAYRRNKNKRGNDKT